VEFSPVYHGKTTWNTAGLIGVIEEDSFRRAVREVLADQTDQFINDYLAVNPK